MGYISEVWLRCREGKPKGKIGFKLKCNDKNGPDYGKITLHDWETDVKVEQPQVTSYPCQREYTACDPNSPFLSNLPENAVDFDCKGPYCKPKCKQGMQTICNRNVTWF